MKKERIYTETQVKYIAWLAWSNTFSKILPKSIDINTAEALYLKFNKWWNKHKDYEEGI